MSKEKVVVARITVTSKPDVPNFQGKLALDSLHLLGFREVINVVSSKMIEVTLRGVSRVEARRRIKEICEKLLVSQVAERYQMEILK